jgi:hypothetical protein
MFVNDLLVLAEMAKNKANNTFVYVFVEVTSP